MQNGAREKALNREEECPYHAAALWLFVSSKGAPIRRSIMALLRKRPMNANEIASLLGVDYRSARHHLEILEKYGFVKRLNNDYGAPYFLPDEVYKNWDKLVDLLKSHGVDIEGD